ncbi:MAG: gliding motility-associated C-terminal domain-containing protein [Bacteroidota bacterium]
MMLPSSNRIGLRILLLWGSLSVSCHLHATFSMLSINTFSYLDSIPCSLIASGLAGINCKDNGTPDDPSDDFIDFLLQPVGEGLGATYTVTSNAGPITPSSVIYGATGFSTPPGTAGLDSLTITLTDDENPSCTLTVELPSPGTCANVCFIDLEYFSPICQDNGTPGDPSDDIFTFQLGITGVNSSGFWFADDDANSEGAMGGLFTFGPYLISEGSFSFKVFDSEDPSCESSVKVQPPTTCSPGCPPPEVTSIERTTCDPNAVGSITQALTNQSGCDSLVVITTTLQPDDTTFVNASTCEPAEAGIAVQTFTNTAGCDSVVTTITTLLPSDTTFVNASTCDPTGVGVATQTFTNTAGCDSIVTTIVTLLPNDTTFVNATTCEPAEAGIATQTFTDAAGCDSVVTTIVTLLPSDTTFVNASTCEPAEAGIATQTFTDAAGCDSVVTTIVTLLLTDTTFVNASTCEPSEAGIATETFTSAAGCDSVVITTITFIPIVGDTTNANICLGDTYSWLGDPFTEAGTYTATLTAESGCDSTLFLRLSTFEPSLILEGAEQIIRGAALTLNAITNITDGDFFWNLAGIDTICSNCSSITIQPTATGTYSLSILTPLGCSAEASLQIVVNEPASIYLPNIFSPNDDGANDFFFPQTAPNQASEIQLFRIFDRWGGLLFEQRNFLPNEPNLGWDGTYAGRRMNNGVYVYYLKATMVGVERIFLKGEVTLAR